MNYEKLWNKLKSHLAIEESDLDKHDVVELMDMFERNDTESNTNRTSIENDKRFEKTKTGKYNPKTF